MLLPYVIDDISTNTGTAYKLSSQRNTVRATGGCPQLIAIASAVPYVHSSEGVCHYGLPQLIRM